MYGKLQFISLFWKRHCFEFWKQIVRRGSVEFKVCMMCLHMIDGVNWTPDVLILSSIFYPLSYMPQQIVVPVLCVMQCKLWFLICFLCYQDGGALVTIPDRATNDWLVNALSSLQSWSNDNIWIGLKWDSSKKLWEWLDGGMRFFRLCCVCLDREFIVSTFNWSGAILPNDRVTWWASFSVSPYITRLSSPLGIVQNLLLCNFIYSGNSAELTFVQSHLLYG